MTANDTKASLTTNAAHAATMYGGHRGMRFVLIRAAMVTQRTSATVATSVSVNSERKLRHHALMLMEDGCARAVENAQHDGEGQRGTQESGIERAPGFPHEGEGTHIGRRAYQEVGRGGHHAGAVCAHIGISSVGSHAALVSGGQMQSRNVAERRLQPPPDIRRAPRLRPTRP